MAQVCGCSWWGIPSTMWCWHREGCSWDCPRGAAQLWQGALGLAWGGPVLLHPIYPGMGWVLNGLGATLTPPWGVFSPQSGRRRDPWTSAPCGSAACRPWQPCPHTPAS